MTFNYLFIVLLLIVSLIYPPTIGLIVFVLIFYHWYKTRETPDYPTNFTDKDRQVKEGKQLYEDKVKLELFMDRKRAYLKSYSWKDKSSQRFHLAKGLCEACHKPIDGEYHTHHVSGYDKIPNDTIDDIRVLHPDCHEKQHLLWGYPKTLNDYMNWNAPLIKNL